MAKVQQIRMFYIGGGDDIATDSAVLNQFLQELGDNVVNILMESNMATGGDTKDTVMVVYNKEV